MVELTVERAVEPGALAVPQIVPEPSAAAPSAEANEPEPPSSPSSSSLPTSRGELRRLRQEIDELHCCLQELGVNSRGTKDAFGKRFALPVDDEHKATKLVLRDFSNPHGRAFHTSWMGFFASFFSMFAAAPLLSKIRKPSSLNLSHEQISNADIAAVASTIVMRLVTGYVCDTIGPRRALAFLLFVTCPAMLGMLWVESAEAFIVCRAIIGLGLAAFVTCQVWCSQMYNKAIVGLANATAAGWGNLGGGMSNLLMPYLFSAIYSVLDGAPLAKEDRACGPFNCAWRYCYLVPIAMHLLTGAAVLTGRDLPDGNIAELERRGAKQRSKGGVVLRTGLSNVNAWILVVTYGMCFGVELTMNSVAALYFHDYHGLTPQLSGLLASLYGLMNLFARSLGGILSDAANQRFGMRGRLWACWAVQTAEGIFCVLMASVTLGSDAPFGREQVPAWTRLQVPEATQGWVEVHNTTVMACGAEEAPPPPLFAAQYGLSDAPIMLLEPPWERQGAAADCISNQGSSLGLAVFCMVAFSLCVQAAEGLHFGIVPYVSRPALGIVSGMVSAGGNLGAVVVLWALFKGAEVRLDEAFLRLGVRAGVLVCSLTMLLLFVYFPEHGSMLLPARALGKYDPQLVKPPPEYRGADSVRMFVLGQVLVIGR